MHGRAFQEKYFVTDEVLFMMERSGKLLPGDPVIVLCEQIDERGKKTSGHQDTEPYEFLGFCADIPITVDEALAARIGRRVLRRASESECIEYAQYSIKEKEALAYCKDLAAEEGLGMRLIDVEYSKENRKLIFYFGSDNRVDFRNLVKKLASKYRIRIEMKQIGPRDEHKYMGGLGVCGRKLCCATFGGCIKNIGIKHAKEQGLDLSMPKYTGNCGRLMCCLMYELDWYREVAQNFPKPGSRVMTPKGQGILKNINYISETAQVFLLGPDKSLEVFPRDDISALDDQGKDSGSHKDFGAHKDSGPQRDSRDQRELRDPREARNHKDSGKAGLGSRAQGQQPQQPPQPQKPPCCGANGGKCGCPLKNLDARSEPPTVYSYDPDSLQAGPDDLNP